MEAGGEDLRLKYFLQINKMFDKINMLQGSQILNETMQSSESKKLNDSVINKFIDLNFQVHHEIEAID